MLNGIDANNIGTNAADFSIIKRFKMRNPKTSSLRGELFNLFNRVNFDNPINNLNVTTSSGGSIDASTGRIIYPGDFGKIVATSNPRLIQFAIKLNF